MTDVIAHRGASRAERENTIAAFRRAVDMGADTVELDARRTADDVLVVHHDAVVDGLVIATTRAADLPAHVPTLAAALDACTGAHVNIEIKNDPAEPAHDPDDLITAAVIAELSGRRDSSPDPAAAWLISSFQLETIDRCRQLAPDVPTAWLVITVDDAVPEMLAEKGHAAVHPWVGAVSEALIQRCHGAGVAVNTWTCNDVEHAATMAGWGIDGICTDIPDAILSRLNR